MAGGHRLSPLWCILPSLATSLHVCKRDILRPSRAGERCRTVASPPNHTLAACALSKDPKTRPKQRRPPPGGGVCAAAGRSCTRGTTSTSRYVPITREIPILLEAMGSSLPTYVLGWETVTILQLLPTTYVISTGCWTIFEALGRRVVLVIAYLTTHNFSRKKKFTSAHYFDKTRKQTKRKNAIHVPFSFVAHPFYELLIYVFVDFTIFSSCYWSKVDHHLSST